MKGYRIVGAAVNLHTDDGADEIYGVVNYSVDLRTTSQSICVLNAVAEAMTL